MIGFAGGDLAWELARAGDQAAVQVARAALRDIFGSEVDRCFIKGAATRWADDPLARGAYALPSRGGLTAARPYASR